jgi:hypothetical protein
MVTLGAVGGAPMFDWMVTFWRPDVTKPFSLAYRQPTSILLVGVVDGLAGQTYSVALQEMPAEAQLGPPPAEANAAAAAAEAAASAAVWAACLRKYIHPTSTTNPTMPKSGTAARVKSTAVWPFRFPAWSLM